MSTKATVADAVGDEICAVGYETGAGDAAEEEEEEEGEGWFVSHGGGRFAVD